MANSASNETLLRDLATDVARVAAHVEAQGQRLDGVDRVAREARDAARDSAAATKAQDLPAAMEKLRAQVEAMSTAGRSDLVNSITRITEEVRKGHDNHEKRIEALEAARNRLIGATGLVGWLSRHAPWLLPTMLSIVAIFGMKDHHP